MAVRRLSKILLVAGALTLALMSHEVVLGAPAPPAAPVLAEFGEVFPTGVYVNLGAGSAEAPKVDLKDLVGKKPVVFCYWIPEHVHSEETLLAVQQLADEVGPSKLAVCGVVAPPMGTSPANAADWLKATKDRIAALKIHVPVLQDDGFKIGRLLGVRTVPNVAALDKEGRLRMSNAGSLKQTLEYKMDVAGALQRLGSTGQLGTYGSLPTYYPAVELVGKKCPQFEAPLLGGGSVRNSSSLLATDKVNVLIFWAQDCPHCRKSLPEINAYLKAHPEGLNVIGAAKIQNEAAQTQTEEFCKAEGLVFPTLIDQDLKIGSQFMVTSTPTIFIIRPDGVIDSVLFSGEINYGAAFEAKKKLLLKS
ncbi:MAG: TlpA family protein disulfide reductase [Acidobacteriia bacterium]|nr:TlpA family protein disulfide reductase [Terriglobia bacterium]